MVEWLTITVFGMRVEVGMECWESSIFTAHLNDCRSEHIGYYCTFALSLFSLLRRLPHVKGMCGGGGGGGGALIRANTVLSFGSIHCVRYQTMAELIFSLYCCLSPIHWREWFTHILKVVMFPPYEGY